MASTILKSLTLGADRTVQPPVLQAPDADGHKHDRGHVAVASGPEFATGAARLSAHAALGCGAGLVTLYGDEAALREHAAHVTAIMLDRVAALREGPRRPVDCAIIGPGHGPGDDTRTLTLALLERDYPAVLDADALTAFEGRADTLCAATGTGTIMTPHEGEFGRLFGDIGSDRTAAVLSAASRSGGAVLLKGNATVIAAPDGRYAISRHASPWMATAGSGDVLAGMIAAFAGQGVDPFDAACAACWLHGDIGVRHGPGLTADAMIGHLPGIIAARLAC